MLFCGAVPAAVRGHECDGGEEVWILHAPALDDVTESRVVEGEQGFPEARVLVSEGWVHVDVEAVVYEDKFGFTGGCAADEDVSWMGVAVDPAPEEHLGGEEVDHCCHYWF